MKNLTVFRGVPIPVDYAPTQTYALLAKRDGGKTYTTLKFEEQMCDAGLFFVTLDPVGKHWALRAGADGSEQGGKKDVWVFGGAHGDLPLEPAAGELIADVVVEHPGRYVLDVSGFETDAEQDRFALAFAKRLFRRKARDAGFPLLVILEEAESFIPERPQQGQQPMLGAFGRIMRQGRNHGLGMWMVAQRAQALNKGVLSQAEVLVVKQMAHPRDRDAVDAWVKANGTQEQREELMGSLAALDQKDAWVWSPAWLRAFKQARVLERTTFDSSASVRSNVAQQAVQLQPLDVDALGEKIAATIERAKQTDPKELQRRVRELEKQLRDQPTPEPEKVEVPVLEHDQVQELGQLVDQIGDTAVELTQAARDIAGELARLNGNGAHPSAAAQDVAQRSVRRPAPERPSQRRQEPAAEPSGDVELKAGARRMLETLVRISPQRVSKAQLATLVGMKVTGGTYQTYFSKLRREGLIVEGGDRLLEPTDGGFDYLGDTRPAPLTQEEVVETWRRSLKRGARRMLDVLLEVHPDWISKEELGKRLGMEPSGGTFNTYVSTLRRNGLAEVQGGEVCAGEALVVGVA